MANAESKPSRRALHPAVSILCWLLFALAVERASMQMLAVIATVSCLVCAGLPAALPDIFRLVRRSRWLLLSLLLLYAWTTNGAWVWPQLGNLSPTWAGLEAGLERIVRLLLLLASLALLLRAMPREDLVYGLYQLAWPFEKLGFDRRAFAVRLALAMEWAKMEKKRSRTGGMLDALGDALNDEESGPNEIRFAARTPNWQDGAALAAMLTLLGMSL
jgi:energy-coupling factor transporter transmembrane protein EcfT